MKEIVISACEIEKIIAEKYELNPQNGDAIALMVENKTVNYLSENAKKVYYPVAYVWKMDERKEAENDR